MNDTTEPLKTYTSEKPELTVLDWDDSKKSYKFKKGLLKLYTEEEVASFTRTMEMTHNAAGMVRTVSLNAAKRIAEQYIKDRGPAALQGGQHSGAHDHSALHRARADAAARDSGLAPGNLSSVFGGAKLPGEIEAGTLDRPDPAQLLTENVNLNPKPPAVTVVTVPLRPEGATDAAAAPPKPGIKFGPRIPLTPAKQ